MLMVYIHINTSFYYKFFANIVEVGGTLNLSSLLIVYLGSSYLTLVISGLYLLKPGLSLP
jgi:hypothetical protein